MKKKNQTNAKLNQNINQVKKDNKYLDPKRRASRLSTMKHHSNKESIRNFIKNIPPKKQIELSRNKNKSKTHRNSRLSVDITKQNKFLHSKATLINKETISKTKEKDKLNNNLNRNIEVTKRKSSKNLSSAFISGKEKEKINIKYDDYEYNSLDYLIAVDLDKRRFFRVYWSLIKREHLFIFTFFSWNDYNLFSIKLSKFFFLICTDMALNMFFFSDESMHNVYQSGGKYNFFEQLFQMVISTLVSQLLQIFLNYLTMTDIDYYRIKSINACNIKKETIFAIIRCIKYKIIIFYIFTFMLFLFYWYVIAAFCAVYENTQTIFITNSLLSFSMGIVYPFILYFIPAGFRIISLNSKNLKFIYCLSNIIPFF